MASFRPDFHTNLAYNFVNDIYYGRRRLHAYLGRVWPQQSFVDTNYEIDKCECDCEYCENKNGTIITKEFGDTSNPHKDPGNEYFHETSIRDNIVYLHNVNADDVSVVCPAHKWTYGTYYTQWDNTQNMIDLPYDKPFYCYNSEYNVYKCISNNHSVNSDGTKQLVPSTQEPFGVSYDIIQTSDGYLWKYMYTMAATKRSKFLNSKYMPVQRAIDDTFYNLGAIEEIIVRNGGKNYVSEPKVYAVVDPPSAGGTQAKLSLYINPDSGSIDKVTIDDPGSGYTFDPKITIVDNVGSGTAKYIGGGASLVAHTKGGKVEDVSIIDPGLNYSADTATVIIVNGDGEGCVAYPKIGENGSIEGVVITNPGRGYTYANVYAVCSITDVTKPIEQASFIVKFGGALTSDNQSVVEQLSRQSRGQIYAIQLTEPGADYTSAVQVEITGDGTGAAAHAVVERGRVKQVIVDSPGLNYTRAKVSFFDPNRKTPNDNPEAQGYPILPPIGGHGYNAISELNGNVLSLFVNVRSDNLIANLGQEFRQFGLIENLRTVDEQIVLSSESVVTFDVTIKLPSSTSSNLQPDSIVYIDNVFHRVIKIEGLTYTLQQCSYIYHDITEGSNFKYIDPVSEKIYQYEIVSVDSKPNVDKYSGKLLYNSNNVPFYMTDNKTFGLRTYIKF